MRTQLGTPSLGGSANRLVDQGSQAVGPLGEEIKAIYDLISAMVARIERLEAWQKQQPVNPQEQTPNPA